MINKEFINSLKKQTPELVKITINGVEDEAYVRKLKGAEADAIFNDVNEKKAGFVGKIIAACLCDENCKKIITPEDANDLPQDIRNEFYQVIAKVNKFASDSLDEAEKN